MLVLHVIHVIPLYRNDFHSISLGTDFPTQTTNHQFFLSPQALKNLISPPRQTKSPDNSNMLHVFNKTYTNFRTPYKHVIQGVEQNQNVTKLKNNWLFH